MTESYYVLAVDPSLNSSGVCVAKITPQRNGTKIEIVEVANIPNKHFGTEAFGQKLKHIESRLYQLRDTYHPTIVAKENLATNSFSQAEKLAPVHGIIHMIFGEGVIGYSPTKIKKDTSGDGTAQKEDIQQSIQLYLLDKVIVSDMNLLCWRTDDESDAIAILLTVLLDKGIIAKEVI